MIKEITSKLGCGLNQANLLVHLDPFASGQVTYSSCVTVLSQIVVNTDTETSLLLALSGTS